jgi:hypothetical protein
MAKGGARPGAGRKPGTPNKITADIRQAIMNALDRAGGEDYLLNLAQTDPRVFVTLLAKTVPTNVIADVSATVRHEDALKALG